MVCVFPGTELTLASALRPKTLFISEDLPTFDRPAKAISILSDLGSCENVPYAALNSAF